MRYRTCGLCAAMIVVSIGVACGCAAAGAAEPANGTALNASAPGKDITLAGAIALTLEGNPELNAAHCDMGIAEARRLQASLRKNPEVSLEAEDVRLTRGPRAYTESRDAQSGASDRTSEQGAAAGLGESQTTLRVSQVVELGGKRVKRLRVAELDKELVRWDFEVKRLDILTEVAKRFVEVLSAQELAELAAHDVDIAQRVADTVQARVDSGKVSPIESQKARNELAARVMAKDHEQGHLDNARTALAALWGAKDPDFGRAVGDYYTTMPVPPFEELETATKDNPDLARWANELERRQASLRVARAQRVPDLTAELGFRHTGHEAHRQESLSSTGGGTWSSSTGETGYRSNSDNSLVLMFSVPVPLFDRNQGGIKEAEHEAEKAVQLKRKAEVDVGSALRTIHTSLVQAQARVTSLKDGVLPQARDVFAKVEEGYRQGKFSYLDVLDAQRSVYEFTAQYVEALKDYHGAVADMERLLGRPVDGAEPARQEGDIKDAVQ